MCSEVTVKVRGIHVVSPEEEKERLHWEGFAEKEVVVTFFYHNFVNCKATLIWRVKATK